VVFDDVAVDVDTGLEVVQFVVTRVPLEDLGADAFVGGQEPQLHLFPAEFGEHLVDLRDLSALHEFALEVGDAIAQEHDPVHRSLVVLLPVEDSLLDDFFELELGFVGLTELTVLFVLHELVGPEVGEVCARVGENGCDTLVALAVLDVQCEDHRLAPQPAGHGRVEVDLVSNVVGQFHDDVLHDVQHHHLDEVPLFEGLREDYLVGHVPVLVAVVLDDLLLAGQLFVAALAVEHHHHDFVVPDLPVVGGNVSHLDDVRVQHLEGLQPPQLVLHFLDHRLYLLLQTGHGFLDDGPTFQFALGQVEEFGAHVLVEVVLVAVLLSILSVCAHDRALAQLHFARE